MAAASDTRATCSLKQLDDEQRCIAIHPVTFTSQYLIGRNFQHCSTPRAIPIVVKDPSASNLHASVYAIHVDDTAPLVYVKDSSTNGTKVMRVEDSTCQRTQTQLLRAGDPPHLLNNGDEIRIGRHFRLRYEYCVTSTVQPVGKHPRPHKLEMKSFSRNYHVSTREIGPGTHGKIYLAYDRVLRSQVACKIIARHRSCPREFVKQMREVELLQGLSHPNIINIKQVYYSNETIYIFQELLTAGDLFSYHARNDGMISETEIAVIVRQVLLGVQYLHSRRIIHRDLKLENILMTSLTAGSRVVIADFGSATSVSPPPSDGDKPQRIKSFAGTDNYMAPEVYSCGLATSPTGYTAAVDMFSVGIVLYTLLGRGHTYSQSADPHHGDRSPLLRTIELYGPNKLLDCIGRPLGNWPKDLTSKLLVIRPEERPSATQALQHPWFTTGVLPKDFMNLELDALEHWHPDPPADQLIRRLPETSNLMNDGRRLETLHPRLPAPHMEYPADLDDLSKQKKPIAPPSIPIIHDTNLEASSPIHGPTSHVLSSYGHSDERSQATGSQEHYKPLKVSTLCTNNLQNVLSQTNFIQSTPSQAHHALSTSSEERVLDSPEDVSHVSSSPHPPVSYPSQVERYPFQVPDSAEDPGMAWAPIGGATESLTSTHPPDTFAPPASLMCQLPESHFTDSASADGRLSQGE